MSDHSALPIFVGAVRLHEGAARFSVAETGGARRPGYLAFFGVIGVAGATGGAGTARARVEPPSWPAFTCAWRDRSIDSPRMRAISCGAWKPIEFSAAT